MDKEESWYLNKGVDVINFEPQEPCNVANRSNAKLVAMTILRSPSDTDEETGSLIEQLYCKENVDFKDLASLTLEDLTYLNVRDPESILANTSQLFNQNSPYESLVAAPQAAAYNKVILQGCASHLKRMRESLKITEDKLKVKSPEDFVLGEKSYSSRFVLESLTELSNSGERMLASLDGLICDDTSTNAKEEHKSEDRKAWQKSLRHLLLIACATQAAFFLGNKIHSYLL